MSLSSSTTSMRCRFIRFPYQIHRRIAPWTLDNAPVASVLLTEPHAEVRELLGRMLVRLGHEPVLAPADRPGDLPECDVLLLEPAAATAYELAERLRRRSPELPIVVASIYLPSPPVMALDPVAYLVKPFPLAELEQAIEQAMAGTRSASAV
jgi:CheY-like chemotaxis protein